MHTTLVVGASGTVGRTLVPLLNAEGHTVRRATSRSPSHADQVHLDLDTGRGMNEALAGADRLFLLSPPGKANQHTLLNPLVDAARAHGVEKIVLMSAMGADADESAPLRRAERHLETSGVAYNIIRPNWFMQNFQSYWLPTILADGKIMLPTGSAKASLIDARDVAAVAAALLGSREHDNQAFDLTGPESIDHDEIAEMLSRESGRRITYVDIPPDALRGPLLQAGLSSDYVEHLLLILGFYKAGYAERTTAAVEQITGRTPRRFADYARDNRDVWAVTETVAS